MIWLFYLIYLMVFIWTMRMLPYINLDAVLNFLQNMEELQRRIFDWLDRMEKDNEEDEKRKR